MHLGESIQVGYAHLHSSHVSFCLLPPKSQLNSGSRLASGMPRPPQPHTTNTPPNGYEPRRVSRFNLNVPFSEYVEYILRLKPDLLRTLTSVETCCELLRITVRVLHRWRPALLHRTKRPASEYQSCEKGRLKPCQQGHGQRHRQPHQRHENNHVAKPRNPRTSTAGTVKQASYSMCNARALFAVMEDQGTPTEEPDGAGTEGAETRYSRLHRCCPNPGTAKGRKTKRNNFATTAVASNLPCRRSVKAVYRR